MVRLTQCFDKKSDGDVGPQEQCFAWLQRHQIQERSMHPMYTVVREVVDEKWIKRQYWAVSEDQIMEFVKNIPLKDRHLHELIVGKFCKLYLDLEIEKRPRDTDATWVETTTAADAATTTLCASIVAFFEEEYDVAAVPYVTRSHGARKWSKHVVFDGPVIRTNREFADFIMDISETLVDEHPIINKIIDPQVYSTNRCMRMYLATKPKAIDRVLVLDSGPSEFDAYIGQSIGAIPELLMRKLMITAISVTSADDQIEAYVSSNFLIQYPDFIEKLGITPLTYTSDNEDRRSAARCTRTPMSKESGPSAQAIITAINRMDSERGAYKLSFNLGGGMIFVQCKSRKCPYAKREHTSNHTFIMINVHSQKMALCCYNSICKQENKYWMTLNDKPQLEQAVNAFAESKNLCMPSNMQAVCGGFFS